MKLEFEGKITSYDDEFCGVFQDAQGVSISVPGALCGETVSGHVEHKSPHEPRAWGRCDRLLQASPERVKPPCRSSWPTAGMCPGCALMHMSAPLQSDLKKNRILDYLHRAGLVYIRDFVFHDAPEALHYRNRTDLVAAEKGGRFILGAYKPRSHDVVETPNCPILRAPLNPVIRFFVNTARKMRLHAYTPNGSLSGALRYVSLFANENGHVLIDLVCQSADGKQPAWLWEFAHALRSFPVIKGVSYSINDSPNNAIRVQASELIWGKARLPEHHGDILSYFSASCFTQLNTAVASKIYGLGRQWLTTQPEIVWDLYCGVGVFGRTIAPSKALYGAEFSASAVDAARKATADAPYRAAFDVINLERDWPNWPRPDLILVDPPRKGLSQVVIENILKLGVPVLYMSCNAKSFSLDISKLSSDYIIARLEAFDMMPQTRHSELLALLEKR